MYVTQSTMFAAFKGWTDIDAKFIRVFWRTPTSFKNECILNAFKYFK